MKLIIALIFVLLFFNCNKKPTPKYLNTALDTNSKILQENLDTNSRISQENLIKRYPSYEKFLDSLLKNPLKNTISNNCIVSADTFKMGLNNFRIIHKIGDIEYHRLFYGIKKVIYQDIFSDSCASFLQLGKSLKYKIPVQCRFMVDCNKEEKRVFTHNNTRFISCAGYLTNCSGSGCRLGYYPVFTITKTDTSFYMFTFADNITGLRYGNINNDNFLDFLEIRHGIGLEDLRKISLKDKKYENWSCPNSECYRITAISFINGKWVSLKDSSDKEYYILIKLDKPLDSESSFEVLGSYWIE